MKYWIVLLFLFLMITRANAYCFHDAGQEFKIAPEILWSIAKTESTFNPAAVHYNPNGSYDFGVMQINSRWAEVLGSSWSKLGDPCFNVRVGAWILAQCISREGYTWSAVGCYNATTPQKKEKYAKKIYQALRNAQADAKP